MKLRTTAALTALVAASGLATVVSTAGPASAASGWHCVRESDSHDGDPGGISGGVARQWKHTQAAAEAAFNAKGELFGLLNATSTSVSAKLYVEYQPNVFEVNKELKLPKPPNGGALTKTSDRDLPEGHRVYVVVSIHKRGSCKSPILVS